MNINIRQMISPLISCLSLALLLLSAPQYSLRLHLCIGCRYLAISPGLTELCVLQRCDGDLYPGVEPL